MKEKKKKEKQNRKKNEIWYSFNFCDFSVSERGKFVAPEFVRFRAFEVVKLNEKYHFPYNGLRGAWRLAQSRLSDGREPDLLSLTVIRVR